MTRAAIPALLLVLALGAQVRPLGAQTTDSTALLIKRGKQLFEGRGLCFTCHGLKGEGQLGPATRLLGRTLQYSRPEVDSLIALIRHGVDSTRSTSKLVMPPMGGARLNDSELRSLASYVLTLIKREPPP